MASELILRPNAPGDITQLAQTPSTGYNWDKVDEESPDYGATDNFTSNYYGIRRDLYNIRNRDPLKEAGTINYIKVYIVVKGDRTPGEAWEIVKIGGTEYLNSEQMLEQWYSFSHTWTTNPNTEVAWTWDDIDNLQIGVKLQPPGSALYSNCTQVYVKINYDSVPFVSSVATSLIEETTATGNGNITDIGYENATKRGVCYNLTGNPTVADSKSEEEGSFGTGTFSRNLTGLDPGTKYYIRAYAYNSKGYGYGDVLEFTTKPNDPSTLACSVIDSNQIDLTWTKGTGAEKTMIRRKIDSAPASVTDGDEAYFDTGSSFSDDELTRITHYYYRAWSYKTDAPNDGYSDGYSSDDDTTPAELATVVTLDADAILQDQVTGNGEITDTGGVDVTTRGFKYALTKDDLNDVHDTGTYGTGAYEKDITSLEGNTEYWYRAYVINSIGTGYGAWVRFQTAASGVVPTGTKINICSCQSGYTYEMNKSLTDDGETYESYFVLSTDLADKQGLHFKKRLEDIYSYFEKKASGTCKIYVKRDNEADWQYAGQISMTGDEDIIVPHLPSENQDSSGDVDFLASHYLIKFVFENDFDFIGLISESVLIGVR